MSLDGYIAGPTGEYDWIISDPEIDFQAIFAEFDTFLIGRKTFEAMAGRASRGVRTFVFSHTLKQADYPKVTLVSENAAEVVAGLRAESGKDIWLFGGGILFRSLLDAGLVDGVEVGVIPVLLGGGIPLLPAPATRTELKLTNHHVYKSGIALLKYITTRSDAKQASKRRTARP